MSRNGLLGICLGIALGIVGCQNEDALSRRLRPKSLAWPWLAQTHHLRLNPAALPAFGYCDRVWHSEHVIDPEAYKCRQVPGG